MPKPQTIPGDPEGSLALSKAHHFFTVMARDAARDPKSWANFVEDFHDHCDMLGLTGVLESIDRGEWAFTLRILDKGRLFNALMDDLFVKSAEA